MEPRQVPEWTLSGAVESAQLGLVGNSRIIKCCHRIMVSHWWRHLWVINVKARQRCLCLKEILIPLVLYQHITATSPLYQLIEALSVIFFDGCWCNRVTGACCNIIELLDITSITSLGLYLLYIVPNHGVPPMKCTVFIVRSLKQ